MHLFPFRLLLLNRPAGPSASRHPPTTALTACLAGLGTCSLGHCRLAFACCYLLPICVLGPLLPTLSTSCTFFISLLAPHALNYNCSLVVRLPAAPASSSVCGEAMLSIAGLHYLLLLLLLLLQLLLFLRWLLPLCNLVPRTRQCLHSLAFLRLHLLLHLLQFAAWLCACLQALLQPIQRLGRIAFGEGGERDRGGREGESESE